MTRTVDQVDDYHGVAVRDPYRWLEDLESKETRGWIRAQNEVTARYLEAIPQRDEIRRRLTELSNYERFGLPQRAAGRVSFTYNDGSAEQDRLYLVDEPGAERELLLDPLELDGAETMTFADFVASPDGRHVAFALTDPLGEWETWRIMEVDTRRLLDDVLTRIWAGVQWNGDGSGVYYLETEPFEEDPGGVSRSDIYFHRLGTSQEVDALVQPSPEGDDLFQGFALTEDGRFLVITRWGEGGHTEIHYLDVSADERRGGPIPLVAGFDAVHMWRGEVAGTSFIQTNLDAPNGKVVAVDRNNPERGSWRVVVPEGDRPIEDVAVVGGRLIVTYLNHAISQVHVYDLAGNRLRSADVGIGTVGYFQGRSDEDEAYFFLTSFTEPPVIAAYNVRTDQVRIVFEPELAFDPADFETRQVFVPSKDGTRVPLFLTHKRGIELDGSNPTYLWSYGSYGVSIKPGFNVALVAWMEMGGVLASACVRGGGEYGEEWHLDGAGLEKQNSFDDFIAAAEWLCENGYTSRERLAVTGTSAGGLLVAACLTQRPDLFGAAVLGVAPTDMLRFTEFREAPLFETEYGSPTRPEEFRALYAYSPLHNVRTGESYPATLLMTSDGDTTVAPLHSYKFAAALQAAQSTDRPILLRVETNSGHGGPLTTDDRLRASVDRWAFIHSALVTEL